MKKKIKRQKRIVNIAMLEPFLISVVIRLIFENHDVVIPAGVLNWGYVVYVIGFAILASVVDRCPYCRKYLGFRHSYRCPGCGKSFEP